MDVPTMDVPTMDVPEEKDLKNEMLEDATPDLVDMDNLAENSDHEFTIKTWKEDFCFIVENKRLYVSKVILAVASPVFERMFEADFKEKGKDEVELPGKLFEDMKEFLKCIYPRMMKDVTIQNAYQVLALAEEYQVVALKAKCEAYFLSSTDKKTPADVLCKLLDTACLYSLDDLFNTCTKLAANKSVDELDQAVEQHQITPNVKTIIQREIIKKMKAQEARTKHVVDNMNADLQRMATLYNYHRVSVPKGDQLSLEDCKDWNGTSVFEKLNTNIYRPYFSTHKCMVDICGTELNLEFKFADGWFQLKIDVPEIEVKRSNIRLVGKVIIVNGLKGKQDFCKSITSEFAEYRKSVSFSIINGDTVLSNEGYIYHGEIGVEVHLLVLKVDVN